MDLLGFVLVLTLVLLFVMFMSSKSQGLARFEESFFQRDLLIENFNRLRIKMGDRVINHVLIGKNGWMDFINGMDDYQNAVPFSPASLKRMAATIQACHQFAKERHMTFLIVVAPNKASIYPDKLPVQVQPLSDTSRLDQLNNYLKAHNIPEVLDLRPALREARGQHDVYFQQGTHWDQYGAYIAYKTILHALSQEYANLIPYPFKFFRFRSMPPGIADLARLIRANYVISEPVLYPTRETTALFHQIDFNTVQPIPGFHSVTWIPDSDLPSLLIDHDSFGALGLNDFLALNFDRAFYVKHRATSRGLSKQAIEQFAPDIFIYEIVERNLPAMQRQLSGCAEK